MKSFLQACVFCCLTLAQSTLLAQPVAPAPAPANAVGPRITFENMSYDFGRVVSGQVVRHDYFFTNTGDAALEISGVHPSCGCTMAGNWSRSVQPGKTGTIPLLFNSGRFNGPVVKTASVISNDKTRPQVVLQLKGTVWKPIEINPEMAVLNVIQDSSNGPALVSIANRMPEPITLSDPVSDNRAFAPEIKTIEPGRQFQLVIRPSQPEAQVATQGTITIKTSSTNAPSIQVHVLAYVQQAWVIVPPEILLPPGPLTTASTRAVTIRNNTSAPMTLSAPEITAGNIPVNVKEVVPGRQFTLNLTFPVGYETGDATNVMVQVKTSDPKHALIQVPVYQKSIPSPRAVGMPTLHRGPVPPPAPSAQSNF